ncbi:MAG: hypothetical protein LBQ55_11120 [Treponema sp.]|jgi:uncharacterized protein GlcG (DUF336 family)|nr:hypothetical protein [Treponema sp.]
MSRYIVFLLTGVLLFASCASTDGGKVPSQPDPDNRAADNSPESTFAVSLEELYDGGYWVATQADAGITVMGIAGRQSNRDKAIAEALADAAQRVALYYGVQGESAAVLNQGSGNLDYFSDFDYQLNLLNRPENYINDLVFDKDKDVLEKNGAVVVRVQYPGVSGVPVYKSVMEDGTPDWVRKVVVDIPGFLTSVNNSKNKGSPQKTYQASYEKAIAALLPQLSTTSASGVVDVAGRRMTQNYTTSSGVLDNVIILETWEDKKTGTIWTLLVAKQKS